MAGGTIIAARSTVRPSFSTKDDDGALVRSAGEMDDVDDECLVVLFRSPIISDSSGTGSMNKRNTDAGNLTVSSVFGYQSAGDSDDNCKESSFNNNHNHNHQSSKYYGLSFLPNGPVNLPFLPNSSSNNLRILHAPSGLLIAATGFAPDVDHILNVAAGRVFSRMSVYDAPSSYSLSPLSSSTRSGKSVDPHRLVRDDLSSMMIDAAISDLGRPLGVQVLVIGQSALSQRRRRMQNTNSDYPALEIYTIDPSGGFRSCVGKGSAVGRGAEKVCSSLLAKEATTEKPKHGWRGALDRAMMAAVDALEYDGSNAIDLDVQRDDTPRAKYGAVVVFQRQVSTSRCAAVSSAIVDECYKKCCERLTSQKLAR